MTNTDDLEVVDGKMKQFRLNAERLLKGISEFECFEAGFDIGIRAAREASRCGQESSVTAKDAYKYWRDSK